jgi:hypothetical protein
MTNRIITNQKYFHCYATANDSRLYLQDLKNLCRIRNVDSGVGSIFLFIAISKVHNINLFDKFFMRMVRAMFKNHHSVKLMQIFYKSNLGRDLSSYQLMWEEVKLISSDEDYILFQNRSGCGPFRRNWYKQYMEQFEKFESVALCGSTINFKDHPSRSLRNDLPHVQTYSFISKVYFMKMFGHDFPGANERERNKIIVNGEIELSQFFLRRKLKITCMEWSDMVITNQSDAPNNTDIKENVTFDHYFYHRKYLNKRNRMKRFFKPKAIK